MSSVRACCGLRHIGSRLSEPRLDVQKRGTFTGTRPNALSSKMFYTAPCATARMAYSGRRDTTLRNKGLRSVTIDPTVKGRAIRGSTRCAIASDSGVLSTFFDKYTVRSWEPEDGQEVAALVRAVQSVTHNGKTFNPEGEEDDCLDAQQIYSEADGAFLVITEAEGSSTTIVGCGAYITGDEVVHLKSGASTSDPERAFVTAIRRTCVLGSAMDPEKARELLAFTLRILESLAYMKQESNGLEFIALGREVLIGDAQNVLSTEILESAGYRESKRFDIPGDQTVKEFRKYLPPPNSDPKVIGEARANTQKGSRELLEVISTKGTVLGVFQRVYVEKHNLLHRAVGLFVQNEAGEVYVHRRAPTKSMHPNMYDMFVGGLVVAGETVEQGARNEAKEELGIQIAPDIAEISPLFTHDFMGPRNRVAVSCFRVVMHKPETVTHDDGEVVWGQWMSVADLTKMIEEENFVPGGLCMWSEVVRRGLVSL